MQGLLRVALEQAVYQLEVVQFLPAVALARVAEDTRVCLVA